MDLCVAFVFDFMCVCSLRHPESCSMIFADRFWKCKFHSDLPVWPPSDRSPAATISYSMRLNEIVD